MASWLDSFFEVFGEVKLCTFCVVYICCMSGEFCAFSVAIESSVYHTRNLTVHFKPVKLLPLVININEARIHQLPIAQYEYCIHYLPGNNLIKASMSTSLRGTGVIGWCKLM